MVIVKKIMVLWTVCRLSQRSLDNIAQRGFFVLSLSGFSQSPFVAGFGTCESWIHPMAARGAPL